MWKTQQITRGFSTLRQHTIRRGSGYLYTLVFILVAFGLTVLFGDVIADSRYLFYWAAIIFSAWLGGLGPGLLATLLTMILTNLYPDMRVIRLFADARDLLQLLIFLLLACVVSYLEEARARVGLKLQDARDQLEIVLHGVADGILVQDQNERLTFANETATLLLGGMPESQHLIYTQALWARYDLFDQAEQLVSLEDLPMRVTLRQRRRVHRTLQLIDKFTGQRRWVVFTSSLTTATNEGTQMVITILRDITAQQLAEQERAKFSALLEAERERLREIVAHVPGVIWESAITDGDGKRELVFINDYVEHLFGYSRDEALTNPDFWAEVVHPDDLPASGGRASALYESGQAGVIRFRAVHKLGQILDIEAHLSIIQRDGQTVGARGVMMDISQRQQHEKVLARYTQMLRRSNEELQQFAYIASHDLQEPLRMVTSYLQLLERRYNDQLDDDAREFIAYAVDGAVRMKALINDLLAYSRVEKGEQTFESVDAEAAFKQTLANLSAAIEESGATITHDDPLPNVQADHAQLVQLFQNLIGNAIKFRSERPPEIHVGVQRADGCHHFSVRDNGIGIEADYLERIFVVFQRLHGTSEYSGTGIGLAICKKVVERHGGRIWVESTPQVGTTFHFTLPLTSQHIRN